jgi:hypothetical protein
MKFEIIFNGNGKQANGVSACDKLASLEEAKKQADFRAKEVSGHMDFVSGQFDVWEETEQGADLVYSTDVIK